ncbi:MAG: antitoxin VapB family protein, partial [Gammaproteobacteria bacterium]
MGYKTITVSEAAYRRLRKRKGADDSFSDVILREIVDPSLPKIVAQLWKGKRSRG